MAVIIDAKKCTGCGVCAQICPEDVLRVEDGTAVVRYPKECWRCGSCVYDCPSHAIEVDLDIEHSIRFIESSENRGAY